MDPPPPSSYSSSSVSMRVTMLTKAHLQPPLALSRRLEHQISYLLLSLVPMSATVVVLWLLMRHCQEESRLFADFTHRTEQLTTQLGNLIVDLNREREYTVLYITSRSTELQSRAKEHLTNARQRSDQSLRELDLWPAIADNGPAFRSRDMFTAILDRHRQLVSVGSYFYDEIQFFTDAIEVFVGWLQRSSALIGEPEVEQHHRDTWRPVLYESRDIWRWLPSFGYLMASVNLLGAEQALCGAFHSLVCFSHRETFYYANFAFAGEATFALYRQAYPELRHLGRHVSDWKTLSHDQFFPALSACRRQIFTDLDLSTVGVYSTACEFNGRNLTLLDDVNVLTADELGLLLDAIGDALAADEEAVARWRAISEVLFWAATVYVALVSTVRCCCVPLVNWGLGRRMQGRRRWTADGERRMGEGENETDQMIDQFVLENEAPHSTKRNELRPNGCSQCAAANSATTTYTKYIIPLMEISEPNHSE